MQKITQKFIENTSIEINDDVIKVLNSSQALIRSKK